MKKLIFMALLTITTNAWAENELSLSLSSDEFRTSEAFYVTVKNTGKVTVRFISIGIERLVNNQWKSIRRDIACSCMAKCKKGTIYLKPGETRKQSWDFKNNSCDFVSPGVFSVVIKGKWVSEKNRNLILGRSSIFKVLK